MNEPCPFCKGRGKERDGLLCLRCSGTGNREAQRLLYAYEEGRRHERDTIMRAIGDARSQDYDSPSIGIDALRALVQKLEDDLVRDGDAVLDAEPPRRTRS